MSAAARVFVFLVLALGACTPRVHPEIARSETPRLEAEAFIARDGVRLPVQVWLPEGEVEAVIVGVHGYNDYANAFAVPAETWQARGIATYAYDQRGFGRTIYRGQWAGTERLVQDFQDLVAAVRARHPNVPLTVVGTSMGGAVAMLAAADDPPPADGIALAAPAVWGRKTMPFYYGASLWLGAHTLPWARVTGRGLKITPSDNRDMLLALSRDRYVIKGSRIDALYGLVGLMDAALDAAPKVKGPVLVLYGRKDEIVPKEPTRRMLETLPPGRRVAVYEDGYHMLLRDLRAEAAHEDIAAWAKDKTAPLPSGAEGEHTAFFDGEDSDEDADETAEK